MLSFEQVQTFDRQGFVTVASFFSNQETAILLAHAQERTRQHLTDMPDADGRSSKLNLWVELGQDIFGAVSAHPRLLGSIRMLLREDAYHWHSKVMLKEPRVGGSWEWHQDYGYWYHDGCPYPRLVSCLIALDHADRSNGCLKVVEGSHHLGRLDHGQRGNQAGADPERVAAIIAHLPVRYLEAEPGTAIFFHCNTLHASDVNDSPRARTSLICCYNAMSNAPILAGRGHGQPRPIRPSAEDAVLTTGMPVTASVP